MAAKTPRGIRNNNPLNIRRSAQKWKGKIEAVGDLDFEQFISLEHGLRAAFVILRTYITKYRCDTPRRIIARWAPATENNVDAYVQHVAKISLLKPDERIRFNQKNPMCRLIWAMAKVECGVFVSFGRIENAYVMAQS